jgi:methionine sulfoxide reductase heme-binding subunit
VSLLAIDGQHLDWYVVRASGFVAWALVSASVLYGLLHATAATRVVRRPRLPRPAWVLDLHRFLAGLACCATVLHVGALLFDRFVGFGVVDLLVPFATRYRPAALAWGIVAFDGLLIVQTTSLLMARLSRRLWHAIHLGAFVVFATATVHALYAGTDRHSPFVHAFAVAVTVAVFGAAVVRVTVSTARVRRFRRAEAQMKSAPTLAPVDAAIEEVVRRGAARGRRVARHGHRRGGVPRGTPR